MWMEGARLTTVYKFECMYLRWARLAPCWTLDKIFVPEHTIAVFTAFYKINISSSVSIALGVVQLVFVALLLMGMYRSYVYLIALIIHAVSTLSSMAKYFDPFNNLLFFTAWPMLAACLALYLLRDFDNLYSVSAKK